LNSQLRDWPLQTRPGLVYTRLMRVINVSEAKAQLSKLLVDVERGKDVVIGRNGKPVARLLPFEKKPQRTLGALRGKIWIAPDFDEWPEEEARALGIID
jgi:prevent-host-death family protein